MDVVNFGGVADTWLMLQSLATVGLIAPVCLGSAALIVAIRKAKKGRIQRKNIVKELAVARWNVG